MASTLSYTDTIQRVGYTIIDDVKVAMYTCIIPCNKPEDMRMGITKLNSELYKANREVCRADYATFEDAAYQLQEEFAARQG